MASGGNVVPHITKAEHIGPNDTGDNIEAKRVAAYGWDGSAWGRMGKMLTPITDYDYIDVQQTSTTIDTFVFKTGGSGGTTVRTIVITYTDDTKENMDSVAFT